jgi:hypothetical protein
MIKIIIETDQNDGIVILIVILKAMLRDTAGLSTFEVSVDAERSRIRCLQLGDHYVADLA